MFKKMLSFLVILLAVTGCQIQENGSVNSNPGINSEVNKASGIIVPPEQGRFFNYITDNVNGINGDISKLRNLGVNAVMYKNKLYAMFCVENYDNDYVIDKFLYVRKQSCDGSWINVDNGLAHQYINNPNNRYYHPPYRLIVMGEYLYAIWGESPVNDSMVIRVSRYSECKGWESVDGGSIYGLCAGYQPEYQSYFYYKGAYVFKNELYIAWYQNDIFKVVIKKYDGSKWSEVPNEFTAPTDSTYWGYTTVTLSEVNGNLCAAYINTCGGYYRLLQVSYYDAQTKKWIAMVKESLNYHYLSCVSEIDLINYDQKLFVAYKESSVLKDDDYPSYNSPPYKIIVKQYEGGANGKKWISLSGSSVSTDIYCSLPNLLVYQGGLYMMLNESYKLVLKKYNLTSWDTIAIMSNTMDNGKYEAELSSGGNGSNVYPMNAFAVNDSIYLFWQRYIGPKVVDDSPNKYIFAAKGSFCH
jgi:hypothetical protein